MSFLSVRLGICLSVFCCLTFSESTDARDLGLMTLILDADTRLYTLPCRSVRPSVRPSRNIFEFRAVFALLLLSNRPRLDCRVSGLVQLHTQLHTFIFLPSFLPSFSSIPSFIPSFLPSFLFFHSFFHSFLSSLLPFFLASLLPFFLPSFLPSFPPPFFPSLQQLIYLKYPKLP